ncbi:DDE-type integrase/transposase/recombinase [Candidatus Bandiella numerosa]|uniref:DDE-type integrase/transposase/recombinase n=1 Tax=Candidatus Bandiella numerosa TaxID=2570586 RepID=UPI0039779FC4
MPILEGGFRKRKKPVNGSWRMGETYIKVKGRWVYLYRAVDKYGDTIDFMLRAKRDKRAAKAFFKQAVNLIEEMKAEYLLADRGCDANYIIDHAQKLGMRVVIPPKKNRITQRKYDKDLYKTRHIVENTFLHLKRCRGIATRYAKNSASFLAAIQIRCLSLWLKIS